MSTTSTRSLVLAVAAAALAAGAFALGRETAPAEHEPAADYLAGRADGLRAGRAYELGLQLPPGRRAAARAAFDDGYVTGADDAFGDYDGGWALATPYIVTLERGRRGVTYRLETRTELRPGVSYFLCSGTRTLCSERR